VRAENVFESLDSTLVPREIKRILFENLRECNFGLHENYSENSPTLVDLKGKLFDLVHKIKVRALSLFFVVKQA